MGETNVPSTEPPDEIPAGRVVPPEAEQVVPPDAAPIETGRSDAVDAEPAVQEPDERRDPDVATPQGGFTTRDAVNNHDPMEPADEDEDV